MDLIILAKKGVEAETRVKIPERHPSLQEKDHSETHSRVFSWVVISAESPHTVPANGWGG